MGVEDRSLSDQLERLHSESALKERKQQRTNSHEVGFFFFSGIRATFHFFIAVFFAVSDRRYHLFRSTVFCFSFSYSTTVVFTFFFLVCELPFCKFSFSLFVFVAVFFVDRCRRSLVVVIYDVIEVWIKRLAVTNSGFLRISNILFVSNERL